jgi:hypothetical protein
MHVDYPNAYAGACARVLQTSGPLRMIRILRVMRVFKITKYTSWTQVNGRLWVMWRVCMRVFIGGGVRVGGLGQGGWDAR